MNIKLFKLVPFFVHSHQNSETQIFEIYFFLIIYETSIIEFFTSTRVITLRNSHIVSTDQLKQLNTNAIGLRYEYPLMNKIKICNSPSLISCILRVNLTWINEMQLTRKYGSSTDITSSICQM